VKVKPFFDLTPHLPCPRGRDPKLRNMEVGILKSWSKGLAEMAAWQEVRAGALLAKVSVSRLDRRKSAAES
jgi:hypothetical protein